jgi:hypothetical protein
MLYRARIRMDTGKTPTIKEVCDEVIARGGMISAVGGDVEALARANVSKKGKRRTRFKVDSTRSASVPDPDGGIFADHSITNAGTLRARYYEADAIAKRDRGAWSFWRNQHRHRLGFPMKVLRRK